MVHTFRMSTMIQIRNVPGDLHRTLKARAAQSGMSLSEYLLKEIDAIARRPTIAELTARIKVRGGTTVSVDAADIIRAERDRS